MRRSTCHTRRGGRHNVKFKAPDRWDQVDDSVLTFLYPTYNNAHIKFSDAENIFFRYSKPKNNGTIKMIFQYVTFRASN